MDFFSACELAYKNGIYDALHNRIFRYRDFKKEFDEATEGNAFLHAYLRGFTDAIDAALQDDAGVSLKMIENRLTY